jgi:superfamily II DNA or RNA helicase
LSHRARFSLRSSIARRSARNFSSPSTSFSNSARASRLTLSARAAERFRGGEARVLLTNVTKGLDAPEANHVYLLSPPASGADCAQALGRATRLGGSQDVTLTTFSARATLESAVVAAAARHRDGDVTLSVRFLRDALRAGAAYVAVPEREPRPSPRDEALAWPQQEPPARPKAPEFPKLAVRPEKAPRRREEDRARACSSSEDGEEDSDGSASEVSSTSGTCSEEGQACEEDDEDGSSSSSWDEDASTSGSEERVEDVVADAVLEERIRVAMKKRNKN